MREIGVAGASIASYTGQLLAESDVHAHNDFAHPNVVHPNPIAPKSISATRLIHTFPPASVSTLQLTLA